MRMAPNGVDQPEHRYLRAVLFWAARWLLGGSSYHRGPLRVVIDTGVPVPGERLIVRPQLVDELYDADNGPCNGEAMAALAPRLLAHFLSPDSRRIMAYIAERGPVASKVVVLGAGVEREKCYAIPWAICASGDSSATPAMGTKSQSVQCGKRWPHVVKASAQAGSMTDPARTDSRGRRKSGIFWNPDARVALRAKRPGAYPRLARTLGEAAGPSGLSSARTA